MWASCGACRLAVYKAIPLTDLDIATGIARLTDAHVRIINLSVTLEIVAQDIVDALNYAIGAGVLVVAASGNEGLGTVDFPAAFLQPQNGTAASGIAVGAADAAGNRAAFSNSGSQLSLLAPGSYDQPCTVGVLGAIPPFTGEFDSGQACDTVFNDPRGNRYAYASGTSFAAPAVAGVAALVWAAALADERPGGEHPRADRHSAGRDELDRDRRLGRAQRARGARERDRPVERGRARAFAAAHRRRAPTRTGIAGDGERIMGRRRAGRRRRHAELPDRRRGQGNSQPRVARDGSRHLRVHAAVAEHGQACDRDGDVDHGPDSVGDRELRFLS